MVILYIVVSVFLIISGICGIVFSLPLLKKGATVEFENMYDVNVSCPIFGNPHLALSNEDDIKDVNRYIDKRLKEFGYGTERKKTF